MRGEDDERHRAGDRSADRREGLAVVLGEVVAAAAADVGEVARDVERVAGAVVEGGQIPELVREELEVRPDRLPIAAVPAGEFRGAGHVAGEVEVARGVERPVVGAQRVALGVGKPGAERRPGLAIELRDAVRRDTADRGVAAAGVERHAVAVVVQDGAADDPGVRTGNAELSVPSGRAGILRCGGPGDRGEDARAERRSSRNRAQVGHEGAPSRDLSNGSATHAGRGRTTMRKSHRHKGGLVAGGRRRTLTAARGSRGGSAGPVAGSPAPPRAARRVRRASRRWPAGVRAR